MGFFFKSRKKYNGIVDVKLNNEYGISTRSNPEFPGLTAYLNLIDSAWNLRMTEDEAAMMIATFYCCGLTKIDINRAAAAEKRFLQVAAYSLDRGLVSADWFFQFKEQLVDASNAYLSSIDKCHPSSLPVPPTNKPDHQQLLQIELREAWEEYPSSHAALQNMVMAMAEAENVRAKKTIIGPDKTIRANEKFRASFKLAISALFDDNLLNNGRPAPEVANEFAGVFQDFVAAYPNWQDAYQFFNRFFEKSNNSALLEIIQEVINFQEHLDRPMIYYGPKSEKPNDDNKWWETDPRIKKGFDARKR